MNKYLPSRKFIKWTGWSVAAAVVIFLIGNFIRGREEIFQAKRGGDGGSQLNVTFKDVVERDTDSDGLLDWEEALWGMDLKNPDSDGDGISDGIEVEAQRLALNAGAKVTPQEEVKNKTMTENFAKELLTTVLALQQSGNLTEENLQKITDAFEKEIKSSERVMVYDSGDLKLVADSSQTAGKYAGAVNKILEKYPIEDEGVPAVIERALAENSAEELDQIDPSIKKYQSMAEELMTLNNIPRAAASAHLQLANGAYNLADDFQSMKAVFDDPIRTFLAIIRHEQTLGDFQLALNGISSYFQSVKSTITQ